MKEIVVDSKIVKIGDKVGFKSDVEQIGRVIKIEKNDDIGYNLTLENPQGFSGGDNIKVINSLACWV